MLVVDRETKQKQEYVIAFVLLKFRYVFANFCSLAVLLKSRFFSNFIIFAKTKD